MLKILRANTRDLQTLVDLDLKSHTYTWANENWTRVFGEPTCVINLASSNGKSVGFSVARSYPDELHILRMGVLPAVRNCGIASKLMENLEELGRSLHAKKLTIIIPELHCLPGDPDDVSAWLNKRDFYAKEIIKDLFIMYGDFCDGFKFTKVLYEK